MFTFTASHILNFSRDGPCSKFLPFVTYSRDLICIHFRMCQSFYTRGKLFLGRLALPGASLLREAKCMSAQMLLQAFGAHLN